MILLVCFMLLSGPAKGSEPIRIILNNWTSQIVLSHITGQLFEKLGYRVEYETLSIHDQWGGLRLGYAHVQVEVWEGTMKDQFERMVALGQIVDAGTHAARTREEWWYPSYVEDLCPGLPDWRALRDCSRLFATPETYPAGRYLAGPWEKPERARIRALEMNFRVVEARDSDELWQALDRAYKKKQPIVLFNWTPNWIDLKYEGKFVEFPAYAPECETKAEWGVNPFYLYDCGNPKDGWLKKAAWSGMVQRWPCAYATLQKIDFDNRMLAELAYMVDVDKLSYRAAAKKWLDENEQLWRSWIAAECLK